MHRSAQQQPGASSIPPDLRGSPAEDVLLQLNDLLFMLKGSPRLRDLRCSGTGDRPSAMITDLSRLRIPAQLAKRLERRNARFHELPEQELRKHVVSEICHSVILLEECMYQHRSTSDLQCSVRQQSCLRSGQRQSIQTF